MRSESQKLIAPIVQPEEHQATDLEIGVRILLGVQKLSHCVMVAQQILVLLV